MHAWLCEQPTGVDALQWKELPTPEPGPKQVRVAIRAASLNFPDILIVQNKYQFKPEPPFVPGSEYAGVVEAVGAEVKGLQPGMRVLVVGSIGGFGTHAVVEAVACAAAAAGFSVRGRRRVRAHLWHVVPRADRSRRAARRRDRVRARRRRRRRHVGAADRQGCRSPRDRRHVEPGASASCA